MQLNVDLLEVLSLRPIFVCGHQPGIDALEIVADCVTAVKLKFRQPKLL